MKRRKRISSAILLLCVWAFGCSAQEKRDFLVMFYNTENLFDTIDNPYKNDDEFLPTASRQWDTHRYYKKLNNISKAIVAAGGWQCPDVVGLCEVENDTCLKDLTQKTNLQRSHYQYIHYESEDTRGIDVALLYNPKTFSPISHQPIRPQFDDTTKKSRDVLYVKGQMVATKDTMHIFVCHFPSRRGGKEVSEPLRISVARSVRNVVDSILVEDSLANIVIVGDFNDHPDSKSITQGLLARKQAEQCSQCLVNLQDGSAEGSYKYQGKWNFLDQSIVSQGFLAKYTIRYRVLQDEGLLLKNEKTGETTPFRTYQGPVYRGGFSDHLPITVSFEKR